MKSAIFLDKDGTLTEDIPYNVNPEQIRFMPGAVEALQKLKRKGYLLIVVSNQSGLAHGYFQEQDLRNLQTALQEKLKRSDIELDGFYFCPHHPAGTIATYSGNCECRKPKPGMILEAAGKFNVDLSSSWMIGDILNDVEAGNTAGCKTILVDNGNETEWILSEKRTPASIAENLLEAATIITDEYELS